MDDRIRAYVADKAFKACFFYGHYLIFWWIIWGLMYAFDCPYRASFPMAPYQILETTILVFTVIIPSLFAAVSLMFVAAAYLVMIFAGIVWVFEKMFTCCCGKKDANEKKPKIPNTV